MMIEVLWVLRLLILSGVILVVCAAALIMMGMEILRLAHPTRPRLLLGMELMLLVGLDVIIGIEIRIDSRKVYIGWMVFDLHEERCEACCTGDGAGDFF